MPLLKPRLYTSDDYWNLPENTRAELIDGQLYNMAPPSRIHQRISGQLYITIGTYIEEHRGNCQIYAAPFAVNLDCEDKNWVEPDLSVICDPDKLTDRGCSGAPVFSKKDGTIIGILCGSQTEGDSNLVEEINYVLPVKYILENVIV